MERLSVRYAALSLGYMGFLFYLSSLPGSATGPNTPFWRLLSNAAHLPLHGGLAGCLALTLRAWPSRQRVFWVLGIGTAYAFLDEWHQSFVPGRDMSLTDLGLDLGGVLLVVVALRVAGGRL